MIDRFEPAYFAYGIEANMVAHLAPEKWSAFVTLASEVYQNLKAGHPTLPIFLTFHADTYHASPGYQSPAIANVLPVDGHDRGLGLPVHGPARGPGPSPERLLLRARRARAREAVRRRGDGVARGAR